MCPVVTRVLVRSPPKRMYGLVRYVRRCTATNGGCGNFMSAVGLAVGGAGEGLGAQVFDDHVAEHAAVALAQRRVERVASEDCAEGVAGGGAGDAERAGHHLEGGGGDVAGGGALPAPPREGRPPPPRHPALLG